MGMLWPGFLLLLALIPLAIWGYWWMLRRRRRFTVRYSSLSLVREALAGQSQIRRHLPFALFLLAIVSLVIALGRPVTAVGVPGSRATIILALDVSRSMCSVDIPPNRLRAAEEAALSFIQRQQSSTQIGLVGFAGFAQLLVPPTTDPELLEEAIENLTTGRRTAIGSAILESLDAIAEIDGSIAPSVRSLTTTVQPAPTPVAEDEYVPSIIVLLTDGASNAGPSPLEAAAQAVERGVRVYTIGFGTAQGGVMDCGVQYGRIDPFAGASPQFGTSDPFGGGGGGFRRGIDEDTLQQVADMTGGEYYSAESADELQNVFDELPTSFLTRYEMMEISVAFVAVGALLALLAILLSMIWNPLP
jgi:Ca-activated chloride channel homolog